MEKDDPCAAEGSPLPRGSVASPRRLRRRYLGVDVHPRPRATRMPSYCATIAKRPPEGESARDKQYDGHTELGEQEHVATRARHSRGPEPVKQSLPLADEQGGRDICPPIHCRVGG